MYSFLYSVLSKVFEVGGNLLPYHRCYIWQKLTCRVYYSYLRQAIHDRVTSEVNIPKMQMAAIFSLDLSLADELRQSLAMYTSLQCIVKVKWLKIVYIWFSPLSTQHFFLDYGLLFLNYKDALFLFWLVFYIKRE